MNSNSKYKTENQTEIEKRRKGLTRLTWPSSPPAAHHHQASTAQQAKPVPLRLEITEDEFVLILSECWRPPRRRVSLLPLAGSPSLLQFVTRLVSGAYKYPTTKPWPEFFLLLLNSLPNRNPGSAITHYRRR